MVSTLTLPEKRRKAKLLRRRAELRRDNGILFYKPHYKQDLFHRAYKYKRRYARTGNRFGKSEMGVVEDLDWLLGERLWVPKDDPFRTAGLPPYPTKGLLLCTDWDKATEIFTSMEEGTQGKLIRFLPKSRVARSPHRNHGGHVDKVFVKHASGGISTLYIDTVQAFKQNSMGAESSDWDFIHVDEPIPEAFWKAVARGLIDRSGSAWFTCTPLREMWINDYFIPTSRLRDTFDEPLTVGKKWVMTGSIFDNPYLTPSDINDYLDTLDEAERACRERGIPTALSGLIFRQFDHTKHKLDFSQLRDWPNHHLPPQDYTIRVAIDPHPKTPHAVLFSAVNKLGQAFFFAEIFRQCLIKDLVSTIRTILSDREVYKFVCDPIAWIPNPITGKTMADEFYRCGIPIEPASKELEYGIMKTQEALEKEDFLYFEESLKETIYEFDHYTWDEKKEKPIDDGDHMMENLRRLVTIGLTYVDGSSYEIKTIKAIDYTEKPTDTPSHKELARLNTGDGKPTTLRIKPETRFPK